MDDFTKKVDRLDWRSFMNAKEGTPETIIKALDGYFSHFAAVEVKEENGKPEMQPQKCIGCGRLLTGILGTWRWGIAHGVGECSSCGWPSHGHHFIKDEAGEHVATIHNFILQVHPDFVEQRQRESA